MSKKKRTEACCCAPVDNGCCGNVFSGLNSCVSPIIFLLIACGSGVLRSNKSYLLILLFLLCGGSYGNLFGGPAGGCCETDCGCC